MTLIEVRKKTTIMKTTLSIAIACTSLTLAFAPVAPAFAQDANIDNGERSFRKCAACHTIDQGGQHRVGPNLFGIDGSTAGTAQGFDRYSPAMLNSGITWYDETLDAYIANPRAYIPGNRMAFAGIRSAQERADIIAYLKSYD